MGNKETELTVKISGKVDPSVQTATKKVTSSMDKAYNKMKTASKVAVGAIAVGGAALLSKSVEIGSDFEAQMSTVESISGSSAKQMEVLTQKARDAGATTVFTASDAGKAMEYMAMAGWKTNQMLNGLDGILNLAAASGEDFGTTSDIVTDALTAFKLQAKDAAHFSDILAAASSNSNTNVSMMGETFKYAAPVAGALGYSAEDSALAIGLMANSGIKASQAGTNLRKIFQETNGAITLSSKAFSKSGDKIDKHVIKTAKADGSMRNLKGVLDDLRGSFSKMTDSEKASNAEKIAGKTGMAGLLAIVNASKKDYDKLYESIQNCDGAAKKMSEVKLDNFKGDVEILTSELEDKAISIYDITAGPLREGTQALTEWVSNFDVNAAADQIKDMGEAVLDFSEPFLEVGRWMLDNPDVAVSVIGGIAGAITTSHLIGNINQLTDGVQSLGIAVAGNPAVAGGIIAAGAIAGIGIAIHNTNEELKNNSLQQHFGEISFSMDQIQAAANEIIGSNKLKSVGELLNSIDISDGLLKDMDEASNNIKKMNWKVSVGLNVTDDDMESYKDDVNSYVNAAQDYIEQQGYSVNVATNILFDDSQTGNQLLKENNEFYSGLDKEAKKLSDKISKKLKKAVKDGMTPDLQNEVNGLLTQLSDITNTLNQAEAQAKWDTISAQYSGANMNADSFDKMQGAIDDNITEISKGAKEALETANTNTNAKFINGNISKDEMEKEKQTNKEAYDKTISDAKEKGVEFMYNSLMDTYGSDIANGNYSDGNAGAIQDIVDKMSKDAYGTKWETDLTTLRVASQQNALTGLNKIFADANGTTDIYSESDKKASDLAASYLVSKKQDDNKNSKLTDTGRAVFGNTKIDFTSILSEPAKEGGKKAGTEISNSVTSTIKEELGKGISANVPLDLSGTFNLAANTFSQKQQKGNKVKIPGHATGIISRKEHLAMVSEGNSTESIIPIDGSSRSRSLYEKTGKLLGYGKEKTQSIVYSPKITVNAPGAKRDDAEYISNLVEKKVRNTIKKMSKNNSRLSLG